MKKNISDFSLKKITKAVTNDGNSRRKGKEARHRNPWVMPSLVFIDRFYIVYL